MEFLIFIKYVMIITYILKYSFFKNEKMISILTLIFTQFIWSGFKFGFNPGLGFNPELKLVLVIKPIVN